MKLPAAFTTKLGPLPAWVWGVGAGATIIAITAFRRFDRGAVESGSPEPPADGAPITDEPIDDTELAPYRPGIGYRPPDATPPILEPPPPRRARTNREWRAMAVEYITDQLGAPGGRALNAVLAYLAGNPLADRDADLIAQAIAALGAPPENPPRLIRRKPKGQKPPRSPKRPGTSPPRDTRRPYRRPPKRRGPIRGGLPYMPSRAAADPVTAAGVDPGKGEPPPPVHRPIDDIKPPPVRRPIDDIKPPPVDYWRD